MNTAAASVAPQAMAPATGTRPVAKQNWVLDPFQDALFIIGAPILVTLLSILSFRVSSVEVSLSRISVVYIVFTVAHHLPTFIRIYGDVDLFRRFKWSFILGPLIPFGIAAGVLTYINVRNYPLEYFFYLLIILTIWDPWHFLMQHYGFMRIYDRNNAAPRKLAARMDYALCATWFAFIMLASGDWVTDLLRDLYARADIPLVFTTSVSLMHGLQVAALVASLLTSAAYCVYLAWCWKRGFTISRAKLLLFAVTFGVMFLTYTPNPWILGIVPAWSFKVGFASMGIVHVTQYLAIVWRYNRSLAARPERARPGLFSKLHSKGGIWIAAAYVIACLAYGDLLTGNHANRWLAATLLALGFTSTTMHYYFDGFIWKIRHKQNQEALKMEEGAPARSAAPAASVARTATRAETPTLAQTAPQMEASTAARPPAGSIVSWWTAARTLSAWTVLGRQFLYFGVPMAVLTYGATWAWNHQLDYRAHLEYTDTLYKRGLSKETLEEARVAVTAMDQRLKLVQKLAEIHPTAENESELAFLLYRRSQYAEFVIPSLEGQAAGTDRLKRHFAQVEDAIRLLRSALDQGGELGHFGSETITPEYARTTIRKWQDVAEQCRKQMQG